jgi:hypothetical protein
MKLELTLGRRVFLLQFFSSRRSARGFAARLEQEKSQKALAVHLEICDRASVAAMTSETQFP